MLLSIGYGCGRCFTFVCFDDVLIEYWCCLLVVSIVLCCASGVYVVNTDCGDFLWVGLVACVGFVWWFDLVVICVDFVYYNLGVYVWVVLMLWCLFRGWLFLWLGLT